MKAPTGRQLLVRVPGWRCAVQCQGGMLCPVLAVLDSIPDATLVKKCWSTGWRTMHSRKSFGICVLWGKTRMFSPVKRKLKGILISILPRNPACCCPRSGPPEVLGSTHLSNWPHEPHLSKCHKSSLVYLPACHYHDVPAAPRYQASRLGSISKCN